MFSNKQHTDKFSNKHLEHLAAKEMDVSLSRWWRSKPEQKETEYSSGGGNGSTRKTPQNHKSSFLH